MAELNHTDGSGRSSPATTALPAQFVVTMPDDSMSGSVERGARLYFETAGQPAPGEGVIVGDRSGNRYLRRYSRGSGASWQAQAANPSSDTLDSDRDGLTVLAVMKGRMEGAV